jgi:hypothetical protein
MSLSGQTTDSLDGLPGLQGGSGKKNAEGAHSKRHGKRNRRCGVKAGYGAAFLTMLAAMPETRGRVG